MQLTDVRIKLCEDQNNRLKAFCALTFDNTFVIRDVKLIDGNDGLFLAMPSRKLADHCHRCGEKNHLRARYCNQCGSRLDEQRYQRYQNGNGNGHSRLKLHADIASSRRFSTPSTRSWSAANCRATCPRRSTARISIAPRRRQCGSGRPARCSEFLWQSRERTEQMSSDRCSPGPRRVLRQMSSPGWVRFNRLVASAAGGDFSGATTS